MHFGYYAAMSHSPAVCADGVSADVGRDDEDSDIYVDGVPDANIHLAYRMVGE